MNAEYAVATAGDRFAEMFANMEDDYFKARAVDIKDISERIIHILLGRESQQDMGAEPVILMADDLVPSETVQLDKELLLALITKKSSVNSHTAILARTMNIPAITKVDIRAEWHGKTAIVDSYREQVIIDPSEEVLQEYRVLLEQEKEKKAMKLEVEDASENIWRIYNLSETKDITFTITLPEESTVAIYMDDQLVSGSETEVYKDKYSDTITVTSDCVIVLEIGTYSENKVTVEGNEIEFNEDNWYLDTPADYTFNVEYNQSKQTDQEEDNSQEAEVEEE